MFQGPSSLPASMDQAEGSPGGPPWPVPPTSLDPIREQCAQDQNSPCKYAGSYWVHQVTGEVKPFNCGSWYCEQHRASVAWQWAIRCAVGRPERMITLTAVPKARESARRASHALTQAIRREFGPFEYIRFTELGSKTGMLHWHFGQIGTYIPQAWLSSRCESVGLGRVVDIRATHGAGPAFYLAKYVTKDLPLPGSRKATCSKGWPRAPEKPVDLNWKLVLKKRGYEGFVRGLATE